MNFNRDDPSIVTCPSTAARSVMGCPSSPLASKSMMALVHLPLAIRMVSPGVASDMALLSPETVVTGPITSAGQMKTESRNIRKVRALSFREIMGIGKEILSN